MTQLDTLRFLFFLPVAWAHWTPKTLHFGLPLWVGVQLFYVLSGFLITGILLNCRWPSHEENPHKASSIRQFYIRRFLRIFPLYYMVLLMLFIFNIPPVRQTILWHLFYGTNFYFVHHGGWHGQIAPFWSLSVEEQFYIFWPLLVLFAPRKKLVSFIGGLILLSPLYRIFMPFVLPSVRLPEVLPIANFDTLGMGSLLALLRHPEINFRHTEWLKRHKRSILWFSFVVYVVFYTINRNLWNSIWWVMFENTFLAVFFASFIYRVSKGFRGVAGKILEFKPFLYLGKISYGLYILHNLAVFALVPTMKILGLPQHWLNWLPFRLFLLGFWTVAGAALSWQLYESPINNLKRHFPYVKRIE